MAEKEYIERKAAIEALTERAESVEKLGAIGMAKDIKRVIKFIKKFPAADVAEVVHAEWLPVSDDDQYEGEYHCSRCNAEEFIPDRSPFPPYCWQCGARMDGGKT